MLFQKLIFKIRKTCWHSITLASCLLLWQSVLAEISESSSLPNLGMASAIDSNGQAITINTEFFGGISVNGEAFAAAVTQNPSDQANVQGLMVVDDQQVGESVDILIVIGYKPLVPSNSTEIFYLLGEGNQIWPWNMQISSLIPYQRGVKLAKSQPVNIYQGSLGSSGLFRIIFGYRLTSGVIVFSTQALTLTVNDENAVSPYGAWEDFLGQNMDTLALPDYYSNYFAFSFERTGENQYTGLRISGDFAYARYLSYNIYDAKQGTSYGSLTDFQIQPLPGNINPYIPGNDFQTTARKYAITVLPKGYAVDEKVSNVFTFDSQAIDVLTVMIRHYVPQGDAMGSVPLPTVEAFDVRTNQTIPLPSRYSIKSKPEIIYGYRLHPIFDIIVDDTLRFYHSAGGGQFNNADNAYLITAVEPTKNEVLLIRLRPPTYATNNREFGSTQVRYWSINQGNANTSTPIGMRDEAFKIATDGLVYLAVGDERIRTIAERRGYNFMLWQVSTKQGVLLYRNLITNSTYPGNLQQVPQLDLTNPQNIYSQDAKNYIGDYAPTGKKVNITDFLNGSVDIVPPK